jgi:uncharacterized RDD family membrane protein YckC
MDRRDIGSWLQGPSSLLQNEGEFVYPGSRLGLPQTGVGSLARFGRRLIAVFIDWFSAMFLTSLFAPELASGSNDFQLLTLAIFTGQTAMLLGLSGSTFGYRLVGLGLRTLEQQRVSPGICVLRQLLLILVVPVLIWDRDGRSLLDRWLGLVVLRVR